MKPCWLWPGTRNRDDYAVIQGAGGKQLLLSRVLWEQAHGPIPKGFKVLHRCDRPACVRLVHFFLGTAADNVADKVRKGRQARGETHGNVRLTAAAVLEIRHQLSCGVRGKTLARRYNVSPSTISAVRSGQNWSHV